MEGNHWGSLFIGSQCFKNQIGWTVNRDLSNSVSIGFNPGDPSNLVSIGFDPNLITGSSP